MKLPQLAKADFVKLEEENPNKAATLMYFTDHRAAKQTRLGLGMLYKIKSTQGPWGGLLDVTTPKLISPAPWKNLLEGYTT